MLGQARRELAIAGLRDEGECSVFKAQSTLAYLRLDGTQTASIRMSENVVTVGDHLGRVIVFDLERRVTRRDLRVS